MYVKKSVRHAQMIISGPKKVIHAPRPQAFPGRRKTQIACHVSVYYTSLYYVSMCIYVYNYIRKAEENGERPGGRNLGGGDKFCFGLLVLAPAARGLHTQSAKRER